MSFDLEKRHHLALLAQARVERRADEAAYPTLDLLNARADAYTTSSCAGRIQLLDLPEVGDKAGSTTLGRWHDAPTLAAVDAAYAARVGGDVWLFAQPPIFHIEARTLAEAEALLALGRASGFKNVSLRALRAGGGALVELASTERLETPIRDPAHLAWLHPRAVDLFADGRAKLARLEAGLATRAAPM